MTDRIPFIQQKQSSLRRQLNELIKLTAENEFNLVEARLRLDRVRTLYHAYEDLHDELALLNNSGDDTAGIDEISRAFYTIASKIESAHRVEQTGNANASAHELAMGNSTFMEKQRLLKLPVAELPKFDGDLEQWLSFKNTFKVMVDSRTDINDLVKFMYLRSCLVGEAANKINIYEVNEANYEKVWKLLSDAYERKRILIAKHLDAVLEIPRLTKATSKDLSNLIDTARQHVNMLELLKFNVPDYVVVHTLEKALPNDIRLKWEELLELDAIPKLQDFYKFIGGVVFRLHNMEREASVEKTTGGKKRAGEREPQMTKVKKIESGSRTLVTVISKCCQCQEEHLLYRCPVFNKLTIQQRWDSVKAKQICRNCLRKHDGDCTSDRRCKICNRFHHTLLHSGQSNAQKPTNNQAKGQANPSSSVNSA